MRIVLCMCVMLFAGCSVKDRIVGEVAHQVVTCTDPEACKDRMVKECPHGGVLHSIKQAIEVEYSCNPE